jgi:hypothetical protein
MDIFRAHYADILDPPRSRAYSRCCASTAW